MQTTRRVRHWFRSLDAAEQAVAMLAKLGFAADIGSQADHEWPVDVTVISWSDPMDLDEVDDYIDTRWDREAEDREYRRGRSSISGPNLGSAYE